MEDKNITIFTTNCPMCKILEKKLTEKAIGFKIETDVSELIEMGFQTAPILKVEENYLEFKEAIKWINKK